MSDAGEVSKEDFAAFLRDLKREDCTAERLMMANVLGSVWEAIGDPETDPDIGPAEADILLSEFPVEGDVKTGEWYGKEDAEA